MRAFANSQNGAGGRGLPLKLAVPIVILVVLGVLFLGARSAVSDGEGFALLAVFMAVVAAACVALLGTLGRRLRRARDASALYMAALEALPEAHVVTRSDGEVVHADRAALALFGARRPHDMPPFASWFGDAGAARLEMAARDGGEAEDELCLTAGEGGRAVRASVRPVPGAPALRLWRFDEKTAQDGEADADVLTRVHQFVQEVPVGLFSIGREGEFLFVNRCFAGWLGYEPDDMTGGTMRLGDVCGDDGAAPTGLSEWRGDVQLRARDGKMLRTFIHQQVVCDEDGEPHHSRSVAHDLGAEFDSLEALRQSERRFQRFFEEAPIGVAAIDRDGVIIDCNGSFREMTEFAPDGAVRQVFLDLIAERDRSEVTDRLKSVAVGDSAHESLDAHLSSPANRIASLFISSIDNAMGETSGFVLHLIDVTEQKNLELQFAHAQKMQAVGQLAGGVAHDFNNLLTAMQGFCDLLLLRHQPGDQSFSDIMQIKQNTNRAANLIRQLLAFSRQQTLQPKVLVITDVLAELSNLLRRLIGENIKLDMIHGRNLGPAKVDPGQLEQVIINLAVNARDAMPEGGTLTIRTSDVSRDQSVRLGHDLLPPGDYVRIDVEDDGVGIAKEVIGKIFEPFYTTKDVGQGTGLGLSTVYGIVKQFGGFIFVDTALGRGSQFSIFLRRHAEEEITAAEEDTEPLVARDLTGKGGILLVEDEDAVRTFAARALRNKGYTVIEAESGEAALNAMRESENLIDLVVTDVVMPSMDGPTLVKELRQDYHDLKVIFISGYVEDSFRDRIGKDEEIHFLPKPFSLKQLASKVKDVMSAEAA